MMEYDQGPAYPTGRRRNEAVGDFIRRLQRDELRSGTKDIFGPVSLDYSVAEVQARRQAAIQRALLKPMPWRNESYIAAAYAEAMAAKRAAQPAPVTELTIAPAVMTDAPIRPAPTPRKRAKRETFKTFTILGRRGPQTVRIGSTVL